MVYTDALLAKFIPNQYSITNIVKYVQPQRIGFNRNTAEKEQKGHRERGTTHVVINIWNEWEIYPIYYYLLRK